MTLSTNDAAETILSRKMLYHYSYTECRVLFIIIMLNVFILNIFMLNVFMLSVVMLNVFMLSVVMLNVFMLSVVMLNVFMLSVVMLSVMFPGRFAREKRSSLFSTFKWRRKKFWWGWHQKDMMLSHFWKKN